jgi:hypothetical protein
MLCTLLSVTLLAGGMIPSAFAQKKRKPVVVTFAPSGSSGHIVDWRSEHAPVPITTLSVAK